MAKSVMAKSVDDGAEAGHLCLPIKRWRSALSRRCHRLGIFPLDPLTYAAGSLASYPPARGAAAVDLAERLRELELAGRKRAGRSHCP